MADKPQPDEIQNSFKYSVPIQVRFSDIDPYMHVNNGVYFNYLEHARALYLYEVCQWDFVAIGAVVANIQLDFFQPIRFFDNLKGYVRCIRIGTTSFTLEQVLMGITKSGGQVVFAKAAVSMVTIDMKTMKPSPLPEEYGAKIRRQDGLIA